MEKATRTTLDVEVFKFKTTELFLGKYVMPVSDLLKKFKCVAVGRVSHWSARVGRVVRLGRVGRGVNSNPGTSSQIYLSHSRSLLRVQSQELWRSSAAWLLQNFYGLGRVVRLDIKKGNGLN